MTTYIVAVVMLSKRKPFGEAPRDISNRTSSADPNPTTNRLRGLPLSMRAKSAKTASVVGTQNATSIGTANATNATKARHYKALSYSDKITIASQTQRIEALQAELEETKMFVSSEKSTDSDSGVSRQAAPMNDGELLEALVQELESTEADLKAAQSRVSQLEIELQSAKTVRTASTQACLAGINSSGEKSELNTIIEKQRKELEKSQRDAQEGVTIMREIEKALRVARKDRDASKIAMEEALSSVEEYKKQIEEMQTTIQESKQQCGLKEEHSALEMRYAALEKSMPEAKKILAVQSRSEKKAIQMKDSISEAQVREKKSAVEYETLNKKYNAVQRQCTEMEEVLADMTSKLEDVKNKVDTTEKELDMAQVRYDTGVEDLKQQHAKEIERQIRAAKEEVREEERILCEAILAEKESEHQAARKRYRNNMSTNWKHL